ncbi:MAG TPA: NADH:flavin oxidoreductase/NADH oxidase [Luteimicrobium sp.]|nr:NADH:flavin oxidoreductase/NADH oxidase [Luteimicrobium sp.]
MSALFDPLTLRGTTFANRLWVSPMCQYSAQDGLPGCWHTVHLGGLARGGFGLVIAEATAVSPQGRITRGDTGLWNEWQRGAWRRIVETAHGLGAKVGIQLSHAGRKASIPVPWSDGPEARPWTPLAASALAHPGFPAPRAATADDLADVVDAFARSARLAVEAGFDAVELQLAHGFLLHGFLSPLANERTDGYGGSDEARLRLALEVVAAVRAELGDVPLLARVSSSDWLDGGLAVPDVARVAKRLVAAGVDLVDVSTAGLLPADVPVGPGYLVADAATIRGEVGAPVGVVGLVTEAAQAEAVVADDRADVVLVGRAALRDPQLARRWAHELGDERVVAWPPQISRGAW